MRHAPTFGRRQVSCADDGDIHRKSLAWMKKHLPPLHNRNARELTKRAPGSLRTPPSVNRVSRVYQL
jgi:hypothetical protein